jgi:nitrogen fixation NifU-like protein
MESVYKAALLDHFHNPRNKGDLDAMDAISRGSNPRCGDDIEVGVSQDNNVFTYVRFRGRGCSICLASASMMSESTMGLSHAKATQLVLQVLNWFSETDGTPPLNPTLLALDAVRSHPARQKCVTLAWKALDTALSELNAPTDSDSNA